MRKFFIVMAFVFFGTINFAQTHFQKVWSTPFMPMNVYVLSAELFGEGLAEGDEIAIFDGDVCVAAGLLQGSIDPAEPLMLIASADDPTTTEIDGFVTGSTMSFKYWTQNTSTEHSGVIAQYVEGNAVFAPLGTSIVNLDVFEDGITVTSPNGGESFSIGSVHTISWNSTGDINQVNIKYSIDGDSPWIDIADNITASLGEYSWTVPNTPSSDVYIKIAGASDEEVYDISDEAFTIYRPDQVHFTPVWTSPFMPMNVFVLSAALDGQSLRAGDEIAIFDGSSCVAAGILQDSISDGNPLSLIASADDPTTSEIDGFITGNGMSFKIWKNSLQKEFTYIITEYTQGSGTFEPLGTSVVTLLSISPFVQVEYPNGGEVLSPDSSVVISWVASEPVDYVSILYSLDNGVSFLSINDSVPAVPNSLEWKTPETLSDSALIKIAFLSDSTYFDVSDSVFALGLQTGIDDGLAVPKQFSLRQNFPNPFNPTTTITYDIPAESHVSLVVFDVLGREVVTLVDEVRAPGTYTALFGSASINSGVYFVRIKAGRFTDVKKMLLIK